MTIEKILCPDDGRECIYPERQDEGCWNCPKIQDLLQEVTKSGEGDKGETEER